MREYKCDTCGGKGGYHVPHPLDPQAQAWRECECVQYRRAAARIEKSGFAPLMDLRTFDSFSDGALWQKTLKAGVRAWAESVRQGGTGWLMLCGQVGSGKTHLAIAAVRELTLDGVACSLRLWRELALELKRCQLDAEEYAGALRRAVEVPVLYIDDFFKGASVTEGDKNAAYDVINGRYARGKATLLTSEKTFDQLRETDDAVASRIYEMAGPHCYVIGRDGAKNYRYAPAEQEE